MDAADPAKASWWLKVERAQKHLKELERLLVPYDQIRPYDVRETREGKPKQYVYRAWFETEIDPNISIVLGDVLSNLRAALDHVRVALVPPKRRYSGSFPIITEDFRERCAACGSQTERHSRLEKEWDAAVAGMEKDAVSYVLARQPFQAKNAADPDITADRSVLAILNGLRNADEHRKLVPTVAGIQLRKVATAEPDGGGTVQEIGLDFPPAQNGASIHSSPHKVQVKAEGSIVIAVRTGSDDFHVLPKVVESVASWISEELLPHLEHFIRT